MYGAQIGQGMASQNSDAKMYRGPEPVSAVDTSVRGQVKSLHVAVDELESCFSVLAGRVSSVRRNTGTDQIGAQTTPPPASCEVGCEIAHARNRVATLRLAVIELAESIDL